MLFVKIPERQYLVGRTNVLQWVGTHELVGWNFLNFLLLCGEISTQFPLLDFTVVKPSIKQHCNRGIRVTF